MLNSLKSFLDRFWKNKPSKTGLNKFEEMKRNRLIKKMRSNAIAILTNQIELHTGTTKMSSIIDQISDIAPLDNIGLDIFRQFYVEFSRFPIDKERQYYSKVYLQNIDPEINSINDQYKEPVLAKCSEIVEKFSYIKMSANTR
jgi:hypothetical protein